MSQNPDGSADRHPSFSSWPPSGAAQIDPSSTEQEEERPLWEEEIKTRSKGAALPYKLGPSDRPERDEKFYGTELTTPISPRKRGLTETPEEEEVAEGSPSQADSIAELLTESESDQPGFNPQPPTRKGSRDTDQDTDSRGAGHNPESDTQWEINPTGPLHELTPGPPGPRERDSDEGDNLSTSHNLDTDSEVEIRAVRKKRKKKGKKKQDRTPQQVGDENGSDSESDHLRAVRNLFNMPDDKGGPSLRLPSYSGKPDERIDQYFSEIENLALIYEWGEPKKLKDKAGDWVKTLDAGKKDTFAHLKEAITDIFGDRRPAWQKCKDIFNLRQSADQSVIDFAGVLRQQQHRTGVANSVLLAVFIDGLLNNIAKQVAILNPDTFDEAVQAATRLESLEKGRRKSSMMAMDLEKEESSKDYDPGPSLAVVEGKINSLYAMFENNQRWSEAERARSATGNQRPRTDEGPQNRRGEPNRHPNNFSNGFPNRFSRPEVRRLPNSGNEYRGNEYRGNVYRGNELKKNEYGPRREYQGQRGREGSGDRREFDRKKSVSWEQNPEERFCIAHRAYGHTTDSCRWLKNQLAELPMPQTVESTQTKLGGGDVKAKSPRQGNWVAGPTFRQ